mmetsp:Transcript_2697/g.6454  ORF Transcript_2697/g.6454 Transcript_2697/m.6454 type:complete len:280 (+) Transcript_2697:85-924(+)
MTSGDAPMELERKTSLSALVTSYGDDDADLSRADSLGSHDSGSGALTTLVDYGHSDPEDEAISPGPIVETGAADVHIGSASPSEADARLAAAAPSEVTSSEEVTAMRVDVVDEGLLSPSAPEKHLPPTPVEKCNPELQDNIRVLIERARDARTTFNSQIKRKKAFRNPAAIEHIVNHFDIEEYGSNYPAALFDPTSFPDECYYDRLQEQEVRIARRRAMAATGGGDRKRTKWEAGPPGKAPAPRVAPVSTGNAYADLLMMKAKQGSSHMPISQPPPSRR